MIVEFGIIAVVCLVGWSVLTVAGLRGWGIVPLSPIVGTSVTVLCALALLLTRSPTRPTFVLGLAGLVGAAALGVAVWRRRSLSAALLGWLLLGSLCVVAIVRSVPLVKYHIDSFRYLSAAHLLASDQHVFFGYVQSLRRSLAAPVMHGLASLNGEWYLASLSPLLSVSVVGVLAWAVARAGRGWLPGIPLAGFSTLAVLLFVTNNRMVWNTFYVNQHLLFAAGFLLVCVASWLLVHDDGKQRAPLVVMGALGAPLVVLSRPEGFIAVMLAILPGLLSSQIPKATRRWLMVGAAGAMVMWFGHLAIWVRSVGRPVSDEVLFPLVVGVLSLCALPVIGSARLDRGAARSLGIVEGSLWVALLGAALVDPGVLQRSIAATYRNVVLGSGSWGMSLVMLTAIGVVCLVLVRGRGLTNLRFPLTTMAPTFLLLAYLRGGAYRVGNGDSLNRMLTQIVPTLILFVVVAAMMASRPAEADRVESQGGEA